MMRFARFGFLALIGAGVLVLGCAHPTQSSCLVTIAAADQQQSIGAGAGSVTVGVQAAANCEWSAEAKGGFLTITSGASGRGSGTVEAAVSANVGVARVGAVLVASATATITQQAAPVPSCAFTVTPATADVSASGGQVSVAVTVTQGTNCEWTAVSTDSFVSILSGSSGTGNGTVNLSVAANAGGVRTSTPMIAGRTVIIQQAAPPPVACNYTVTPSTTTVGHAGGILTFNVTTGPTCPWQPIRLFNGQNFLSIIDTAARTGSGSYRIQAPANPGTSRLGYIHIDPSRSDVYGRVVQDELPGACQVNVSPQSFNVPAAGGTIVLTADLIVGTRDLCPIFVGDQSWPNTFLPVIGSDKWVQSQTGPTTLTLQVPANPGPARSTVLIVDWGWIAVGNEVYFHHAVYVNVSQAGTNPP